MDIVKEVLEREQKILEKFKPISVAKHLDVSNDLGHLMCFDPNEIEETNLKSNTAEYLLNLTRDNTQLLLNEIWNLPTERVEETVVAKLPPPKYLLPRTRKVPEPKPLTKWQKFAQEKGIKKKKRDKKVFDKVLDEWVPTYGYKRVAADKNTDWVLEVPVTSNPLEDQFKKKKDLKNERIAKNEVQRMKNVARSQKVKIPRVGFIGPEVATSNQLLTASTVAKASTASVGKFQNKLSKEKLARGIGVKELIPGVKRKASHVGPEKTENLELINSILNKRPKIDVEKAVTLQKREDRERREMEATEAGPRRKKGKSKYKGKGGKKPKGGMGQRNPSKRAIGRKRR